MEVSLGMCRVADKTSWRIVLNYNYFALSFVYRSYKGTNGTLTHIFSVALQVIVTKKARYTTCVRPLYG